MNYYGSLVNNASSDIWDWLPRKDTSQMFAVHTKNSSHSVRNCMSIIWFWMRDAASCFSYKSCFGRGTKAMIATLTGQKYFSKNLYWKNFENNLHVLSSGSVSLKIFFSNLNEIFGCRYFFSVSRSQKACVWNQKTMECRYNS